VKNRIIGTLLMLVAGSAIGQVTSRPLPGGINGVVRLPDGAPLEGATVIAKTDCKEVGFSFVNEVKTSADGSFYVPPFATGNCNRIRLFAKKTEDLWLVTGHDPLSGEDNGSTPAVVIPSSTSAEITMGSRGGSVSFRVRDRATDRFIWAELYIKRMPVPGKKFASVQIATGRDGSPNTLLLPAGDYEVAVEQYSCGTVDYFAMNRPRQRFAVQAGQVTTKDISVDVRLIKPAKSYANPQASPCKP
jgi:uncharacterized protein YigE (DUF2233 family)